MSSNTVSGSGADLNVSSDISGNYTVIINSGGDGAANPYVVGETFTIDGTLIGGTTSTHDVTITVTAVDANGVITSATATGFAPGITQGPTTVSSLQQTALVPEHLRRNSSRWRCHGGRDCGWRWLQCWR